MANANNTFPENQPLGTAPGPTPAPAPPRATDAFSKLVGWLLIRDAVARAREEDARFPPGPRATLAAARAHADVADSLLDSGDDATLAHILALYREALLWQGKPWHVSSAFPPIFNTPSPFTQLRR